MSASDLQSSWLAAYRPVYNRLIFGIALFGALVVTHLGIQQERGFDRGCFGTDWTEPATATASPSTSAFDCGAVLASDAGTLLGLSNIVWGLGFYVLVAGLTLALPRLVPAWRARTKAARTGLLAGGAIYSAYLVYVQVATLDAFCALCLTSAGVAFTLLLLQTAEFFTYSRSSVPTMTPRTIKREFVILSAMLAVAVVLAGADLTYFSRLDTAPATASAAVEAPAPEPSANEAPATAAPAARAASVDPGPAVDSVQADEECTYDPDVDPVENYKQLISFQDPTKGNARSPVTIIEFFDPNCPHCKTLHETMEEVVAEYGDDALFVYKPFPLWRYSVPQIQALYAAAQEGKFFDMLDAQFARQRSGGLSMTQLRSIAEEIGMNPDVMASRVESNTYLDMILDQRERAVAAGVDHTPMVLVNNRFISNDGARNVDCYATFIEAAREAADSSAESAGGE